MNPLDTRSAPVAIGDRVYTAWIDASNWATATEAAGVCVPGQVIQQQAEPQPTKE